MKIIDRRCKLLHENDFLEYMNEDNNIISKSYAIKSRVNKAKAVERHFNHSLDELVLNDETMYQTLIRIKSEMKDTNGTISNALRKYYQFKNNRSFPKLKEYELRGDNI